MLIDILTTSGLKARKYPFAQDLYAYCRVEHGMGAKDAPLLQRVGVAIRERDPLTWVRSAFYRIIDDAPDVAIIPDTRFLNEANAILTNDGLLIKVVRTVDGGRAYVDPSRPADHVSEVELDHFQLWAQQIYARTPGILQAHAFKAAEMVYTAWLARQRALDTIGSKGV